MATALLFTEQVQRKIYTDWANHHLGKAGRGRVIGDLQRDMTDSTLLVDVIEAVTGERVPDVQERPRSQLQEVENVAACLSFAEGLGVSVEGLAPAGIATGQLKTILGFFFALSRYKQECKAKAAAGQVSGTPASPGLRRPQPPTPSASPMKAATHESRLGKAGSGIPGRSGLVPPSASLESPAKGKGLVKVSGKSVGGGIPRSATSSSQAAKGSGLRPPVSRLAPPKATTPSKTPAKSSLPSAPTSRLPSAPQSSGGPPVMLEKLKLFGKDSSSPAAKASRLSNSSSGFSSARSETSDSTYAHIKDEAPAAPATPKPQASSSSPFRMLGKKGGSALKPPKAAKAVKPPKVSGGSQTPAKGEDADSAYGGQETSSNSNSTSPSSEEPGHLGSRAKTGGGLKAPGLRPPAAPVTSPTAAKPTLAVKAIPSSGLRPPGKASVSTSASLPKPKAGASGGASGGPPSKSSSSSGLKEAASQCLASTSAPVPVGSPTIGVVSPMTHQRPLPATRSPNAYDLGYDTAPEPTPKREERREKEPAKPVEERGESGSSSEGVEAMQPLVPRAGLFGSKLHTRMRPEEELSGALADLAPGGLPRGSSSGGGGGLGSYAEKMEARFREGLEAVRDSLQDPHPLHDSFEDSSSISSGLSENLDELSTDDLTASSGAEGGFGRGAPVNAKVAATQRQILQLQAQKRAAAARKASEQESIDQLLQKCRTSGRGQGSTSSGPRPKSQQMGSQPSAGQGQYHTLSGPLADIQLSGDGDVLTARSRHPLTATALKMATRAEEAARMRPGSAQGQSFLPMGPGGNAYHSLDRKRYLMGMGGAGGDAAYAGSAALAAIVSPRRYPVPPPQRQPLPLNVAQRNHSAGSAERKGSMSRSMIEHSPSLQRKARNGNVHQHPPLKISPQDPTVCLDYPASPRSARTANGAPALSNRLGRTSRSVSSTGDRGGGENIYANLIQRTSTVGPGDDGAMSEGGYPLSPSRSARSGRSEGGYLSSVLGRVEDGGELASSQLSLASNSSVYEGEMRKLQRDVEGYKDRIRSLNSQQASYTAMVQAFEQALERMAKRIQELSQDKHRKDAEVSELRHTLREMSCAAGLGAVSAGQGVTSQGIVAPVSSPALLRRHTFNEAAAAQQGSLSNGATPSHSAQPNGAGGPNGNGLPHRQGSSESLVSSVSQRSSLSTNSSKGSKGDKASTTSSGSKGDKDNSLTPGGLTKNPKRSWIRSSLTKAFKGGKGVPAGKSPSGKGWMSDVEEGSREESPSGAPPPPPEEVSILRSELKERESVLTDARLDALTSRQQLDELRQQLHKLKSENSNLKQELVRERGIRSHGGSQNSLPPGPATSRPGLDDGSMSDCGPPGFHPRYEYRPSTSYALPSASAPDGLRVWVAEELSGDPAALKDSAQRLLIGRLPQPAPGTLSWHRLETSLAQLFNEYVHRIDPVSNLNLSFMDSVAAYCIGGEIRVPLEPEGGAPIEGLEDGVVLLLHGAASDKSDALALSSLVPKTLLSRQLGLLGDHRRAFVAGSPGVGKSSLALQLASYLALKETGDAESVAVLEAKAGEAPEMAAQLAELLASVSAPSVVVLEKLEAIGRAELSSVLASLPADPAAGPIIIGTLLGEQSGCHLQLQHDFRMILLRSASEPVRGSLGRHLRRALAAAEAEKGLSPAQRQGLHQVLEWLPKLWQRLEPGLEVGPAAFLPCPMDVRASRDWFVRLWNGELAPALARSPSLAALGEEPVEWVRETWPWEELGAADEEDASPETLLRPVLVPVHKGRVLIQQESQPLRI